VGSGVAIWPDYQDTIDTNLRNALVVVVLWSPLSVKSRWVRSEATVADRQGALVPVMIRACERPVAFELVQTADLTRWQGECDAPEWRHFMNDLHAKLATAAVKRHRCTPPLRWRRPSSRLSSGRRSRTAPMHRTSELPKSLSNGQFIDLARRRLDTRKRLLDRLPQWSKRAVRRSGRRRGHGHCDRLFDRLL